LLFVNVRAVNLGSAMDESQGPAPVPSVDALLPSDIARKAETVGAQKARMNLMSLVVLAVLAGAFIGLGAMFATTVLAGTDGVLPFGISRLIAGFVFLPRPDLGGRRRCGAIHGEHAYGDGARSRQDHAR